MQRAIDETPGATTITNPCQPKGNQTTLPYSEIFEAPCTNRLAPTNTSYQVSTHSCRISLVMMNVFQELVNEFMNFPREVNDCYYIEFLLKTLQIDEALT